MKRNLKKAVCIMGVAGLVASNAMTAFAGTWQKGAVPNENRWWYDNGNGTYASNGWQWIDGNNDGLAECYYFDAEGWLLTNTTTPDNYSVNGDGAWVENGVVMTKETGISGTETPANGNNTPVSAETGDISGTYRYESQDLTATLTLTVIDSETLQAVYTDAGENAFNETLTFTMKKVGNEYHLEGDATTSSGEFAVYPPIGTMRVEGNQLFTNGTHEEDTETSVFVKQ
ncbi:MAG: hypothetical protein ACLSX5_15420 [Lachnospiraceae bacterium]